MEIEKRERTYTCYYPHNPATRRHALFYFGKTTNSNLVRLNFRLNFLSNLIRPKGAIAIKIPYCSLLGGSNSGRIRKTKNFYSDFWV